MRMYVQPSLILRIWHHWITLSSINKFFCKQHSFHNKNQPSWDLYHKKSQQDMCHLLGGTSHCSTTFKRQLQTNQKRYDIDFDTCAICMPTELLDELPHTHYLYSSSYCTKTELTFWITLADRQIQTHRNLESMESFSLKLWTKQNEQFTICYVNTVCNNALHGLQL